MDPREILMRGRAAAADRRFEEALRDYVWFHEHALEHTPSLYGVRLSYALRDWMDLAEMYPEARTALEHVKQRKTAALKAGTGDHALFHDVVSINESLGAEPDTYGLFRAIERRSARFARSCVNVAINALVNAGDFKRAHKYSTPPEIALLRLSSMLNSRVPDRGGSGEQRRRSTDAFIYLYCEDIRAMATVLDGVGRSDDAAAAREWGIALVDSKPIRLRVAQGLLSR